MAQPVPQAHGLRRLFQTVTERSFLERLGWPDWAVMAYLSDLLTDCVHADHLYPTHGATGRRLVDLVEMLQEADRRGGSESPERERDLQRQIGDYTLLMTGLFPEGVRRLRTVLIVRADALLDYVKVGKRAYRIVAERVQESERDHAARRSAVQLFRRLSAEFELCVLGLGYVKEELAHLQASRDPRLRRLWSH
ncbi:MAG: hypothetical protein AB1515_06030 [Nitrospirota bacterium]